ncbi:M48 family metalloprotease [Streptacidiphilus cavernicola]|uniref:M48 family metalloprotease n=1 Tax=Streptacidiphilus cavernicola TaxID=3342716 RepID=A0ABV6W3R1_9ACTN
MRFAVWAPLLLPLLVAPLLALPQVRSLPDRLPPRLAAWLLTGTAVGLAGAGTVALGLLALTALLHLPFVAALGHLDLPFARHLAPAAVVPAGAVAGVLLLALVGRAARVLRRHRSERTEAWRLIAAQPGSAVADPAVADPDPVGADGLALLPGELPDAYALPGGLRRSGRIVVTRGMLRVLEPAELTVLLAHERAHLTGRHHLFLLLADLSAALHPLLLPLRDGAAYAVERWADESAAASVADRRLVARAIGRAALAGGGHAPLRMAAGPVPRRVAALLGAGQDRRTSRRGAVLVAAVLVAALGLSLGTALDAATDLHAQVEVAQQGR